MNGLTSPSPPSLFRLLAPTVHLTACRVRYADSSLEALRDAAHGDAGRRFLRVSKVAMANDINQDFTVVGAIVGDEKRQPKNYG